MNFIVWNYTLTTIIQLKFLYRYEISITIAIFLEKCVNLLFDIQLPIDCVTYIIVTVRALDWDRVQISMKFSGSRLNRPSTLLGRKSPRFYSSDFLAFLLSSFSSWDGFMIDLNSNKLCTGWGILDGFEWEQPFTAYRKKVKKQS